MTDHNVQTGMNEIPGQPATSLELPPPSMQRTSEDWGWGFLQGRPRLPLNLWLQCVAFRGYQVGVMPHVSLTLGVLLLHLREGSPILNSSLLSSLASQSLSIALVWHSPCPQNKWPWNCPTFVLDSLLQRRKNVSFVVVGSGGWFWRSHLQNVCFSRRGSHPGQCPPLHDNEKVSCLSTHHFSTLKHGEWLGRRKW